MSTVGTIVVDLALSMVGVRASMTEFSAQFATMAERVAMGGRTASESAVAFEKVRIATDGVTTASNRLAIVQARLAAINASSTSSAATKLAAVEAERIATGKLAEAQTKLAAAKSASVAPQGATSGLTALNVVTNLAGLAMLHFGEESVKAFTNFQYQMKLIQTQARAFPHEVAFMSDAILKLSPNVQKGPEELAKGLFHIESVGRRGADALNILRVAAEGAAVGDANLESVTNALVAAVTTGIKGTEDFEQTMGVLNATVGVGNLRMEDLAKSFSSGVLATAKQFGLGIQDVGAAMATMADQGIPAEEAATRLRITIALLGAPTKLATEQLAKIGLSQRDLAEEMRGPNGLIGALTLLKNKMDAANLDPVAQSQLLKTAFGGSRSSAGILTLINSLDLFDKKQRDIVAGSHDFATQWAEESKTAKAAFDNLGATIETLKVLLGESIAPVAQVLANVFGFLAQQSGILIPIFKTLTAIITGWAAVSFGKMIAGMVQTVLGFVQMKLTAIAAAGAERERAAASAEATAATAASTEALVAHTEALRADAAAGAIPSVPGGRGPQPRDARGRFTSYVADATAVSGVAAAEDAAAASATRLAGAETGAAAAMGTATVAAEALTTAEGEVAVAGAAAGTTMKGSFGGVAKAFSEALPFMGGAIAGKLGTFATGVSEVASKAIGVAMPVAIVTALVTGVFAAEKAIFFPWIEKMQKDFSDHVSEALKGASLNDARKYLDVLQGQLDQEKQGFHPIEDFLGLNSVNTLQSAVDETATKVKSLEESAGISAADGFAAGFSTGSGAIVDAMEDPIAAFGRTSAGVSAAAEQLGADTMGKYAKGLADFENAPVDAFKNLTDQVKNEMTPAARIARDIGILMSQELANGLASPDPKVQAAAVTLQKTAIADLDVITAGAYSAGMNAGMTWKDAFTNALKEQGADQSQIDLALSKVTPAQIEGYTASLARLRGEWSRQAPSVREATAALSAMRLELGGTASISDQAAMLVSKIGDDFRALSQIGQTAGGELMDAVAKGIKERRDAPLNELKEIHNALKDQFSKDREIALLYAELQSQDMRNAAQSQDPYVISLYTSETERIRKRLDELTSGAYSASLGVGAAAGQGFADSKPVVDAGVAHAFGGVAQVTTGLVPALAGVGLQGGAAAGIGVAAGIEEQKPLIGDSVEGIVNAMSKPMIVGSAIVGEKAGDAMVAAWRASAASGMEKAGDAMVAAWKTSQQAGSSTASFAQILAQALKNGGDQAKYIKDQLAALDQSASSSLSTWKSDLTSAFDALKAKAKEFFDAMHEKNLQAIKDAHDHRNALLDAKEALNEKPVTAAQSALDFQRQQIEKWRLQQAVANATTPEERRDAILALQDFMAQAHIDEMQAEVDAANASLEEQKKANDEKEKAAEDAENERYKQQQQSFDLQLAALERFLKAHPKEWKKVQGEVLALLAGYGIPYRTAGNALGTAFGDGMKEAIADALKTIGAVVGSLPGVPKPTTPPMPPDNFGQPPPKPTPAPAPTPAPPPPSMPPVNTGYPPPPTAGGGGPRPYAFALGAWDLEGNVTAQLHAREMVVPPGIAMAIRRILGGRGWGDIPRLLELGMQSEKARTPGAAWSTSLLGMPTGLTGSADGAGAVSGGRSSGGGTLIVRIGEESVYEITDRALAIQDDIYGSPRVVTGSRR